MSNVESVLVAGHTGLLGSEVSAVLGAGGFHVHSPSRSTLDFRDFDATYSFLKTTQPDGIIVCAAYVGGIEANVNSGLSMLSENAQIQRSILENASKLSIRKLVFVSSAAVYPKSKVFLRESDAWSAKPAIEHIHYAAAKLSGMAFVDEVRRRKNLNWINLIPTNIYGLNERWDKHRSHVVASLIMKVMDATRRGLSTVEVWGSGNAQREFLFATDAARAIVECYKNIADAKFVDYNLTSGVSTSIRDLAILIAGTNNYQGALHFDETRPEGPSKRVLDGSRLAEFINWKPSIDIKSGIEASSASYKKHFETGWEA